METLQSIQFYRLALAIFVPLAVLCTTFFLISRRRLTRGTRKGGSRTG